MTTSRDRREAVAEALQAVDRSWLRDYRSTPSRYDNMADAALAAALPDYDAFMAALRERDDVLYDYWSFGTATEEDVDATRDALIALVYGDDAQAGEVTG